MLLQSVHFYTYAKFPRYMLILLLSSLKRRENTHRKNSDFFKVTNHLNSTLKVLPLNLQKKKLFGHQLDSKIFTSTANLYPGPTST